MRNRHTTKGASRRADAIPCPPKGGKTWSVLPSSSTRPRDHLLQLFAEYLKGAAPENFDEILWEGDPVNRQPVPVAVVRDVRVDHLHDLSSRTTNSKRQSP